MFYYKIILLIKGLLSISNLNFDYKLILNEINEKSFIGKLSIQILCLRYDFEKCFTFILNQKPSICFHFAKRNCKQLSDWIILISKIIELLKNNNYNNDLIDSYKNILIFLAEKLSIDNFLSILPNDGNINFYYPFIQMNFLQNNSKTYYYNPLINFK
jgi:hypothetical protein